MKKEKTETRKAFNFYRSYYDVAMELDDENFVLFMKALLNKQFKGIEPELSGISKFAYISQKHSIDAQVEGYENKTKTKLNPSVGTIEPPSVGGYVGGSGQEKEEVKVKEKVQAKVKVELEEEVIDMFSPKGQSMADVWLNRSLIK